MRYLVPTAGATRRRRLERASRTPTARLDRDPTNRSTYSQQQPIPTSRINPTAQTSALNNYYPLPEPWTGMGGYN